MQTANQLATRICISRKNESFSLELQVLVIPRQHSRQQILLVFWFVDAVRFPGVSNHLRFNAKIFQGIVELPSLRRRNAGIRFSMEDQAWSFHVLNKTQRRVR